MPWVFPKNDLPKYHAHPLRKSRKNQVEDLVLVTRKDWGALPNLDEEPLELPVGHVRTDDTKTEPIINKKLCMKWLQELQQLHMREGMPDIQWNFLIDSNGHVYEGRGWKLDATRCEDTFEGIKEDCIDIAFIGTYMTDEDIPAVMTKQVDVIIAHGVKHKFINCCHRVIPYIYGRKPAGKK